MLTFEEIDMLKHALTADFEQLSYHEGSAKYQIAFLRMTEKLAKALNILEHLVDDVKYSGEWQIYLSNKQFTDD